MEKIFPDPLEPAVYNTLALTGGIGLGKSFMAVICMLYDLYRMLCLKDPYLYYGLQPIDLITFAVMNITLDAAKGVAWDKLQQLIQASPWFMERGQLSKGNNPQWIPPKGIELIYGSLPRHIIGRAVFSCFFDEISFVPTQDIDKQKEKARELVNSAATRMQSRFMKGEKNPTLLILASSKRTENSYMESFIASKKANDSATTYVVDEPQWIIREDKNSDRKFKVAVGNKFLQSEVLPLNVPEEVVKLYIRKGYQILDVPIGYYENFIDDIDQSLMDIAGISTTTATKYINGGRLEQAIDLNIKNPFSKEIIEVGNAKDDTTQYYDFFDLNSIPNDLKSRPLYIHLDMSVSGDKTGMAGVWQTRQKANDPNLPINKNSYYQVAFAVAIKAPKGHQISFEKNRNFIRWLKQNGFNIKGISTDSFQSVDTGQQLQNEGFNYQQISVDRVNSDKVCLPYQYFRSCIYEERIKLPDHQLLIEEISNLERNNNSGKVDHPDGGTKGSKDISDAVCGAVWHAQQYADQFVHDYGEDIDSFTTVSSYGNEFFNKKQITVDFEEALKQVHLFEPQKNGQIDEGFGMDFGMGKAQPIKGSYADVGSGIIIW